MTIKAGVDFTKTIRDGIFKFFLMSHYAYVKLHHVLQFRKEKTQNTTSISCKCCAKITYSVMQLFYNFTQIITSTSK